MIAEAKDQKRGAARRSIALANGLRALDEAARTQLPEREMEPGRERLGASETASLDLVEGRAAVAKRAAVATASGDPVRLVILDETLDDGEGESLVLELRASGLDPACPVLLIGDRRRVRDFARLQAAGANGWIGRPWRFAAFAQVLQRLASGTAAAGGEFVTRESALAIPATSHAAGSEAGAPGAPSVSDMLDMLAGPRPFEGVRILLAEDIPTNQKVATRLLEKIGCSVLVAENGAVAFEKFKAERFDLVLMDCQMPGMDGYETTTVIRGLESGRSRVPIVALTANTQPSDRERCAAAGMDDFLAKPIQVRELHRVLRRWLVRRAA